LWAWEAGITWIRCHAPTEMMQRDSAPTVVASLDMVGLDMIGLDMVSLDVSPDTVRFDVVSLDVVSRDVVSRDKANAGHTNFDEAAGTGSGWSVISRGCAMTASCGSSS